MKNLKIASTFTTTGNNEITEILKGTQKVCVDTLNGDIYFAVGNHKLVVLDKNMMQSKVITIPLADFDIKDDSKISDLDFLYDDQRLCLIYEQGQILTMDAEALKLTKVCELGKRISGCAWSPESWGHQRLIIGTETCLFMLSKTSHIHESQGDFKILTEVSLRPTSSGKDQLVTVGWGSTETQFQGSAGKQNREKQNPNKIPIAIRGEFDDRKLLISWRSDGRFFAVSSVDELVIPRSDSSSNNVLVDKISCRQVRVWSRDLEFMSKCEFVSGMEAALCMRPTGNLIAVPRILDNDRFIWFFERNGQFRSKFKHSTLSGEESIGQTVVRRILWNLDSSILAIIFCNKDGLNQIQFWVVSNYSWMEKLRLDADTKVVAAFWDSKVASKFHHVTANGHYHQLSVQFEYDCEDILALSIDGGRLRVTDFRMATIPPPMCHYEIALDFAAAPSAFLHSPQHGLALIGSDYKYMLFFDMIDRKFLYRKYFLLAQNNNLLYNLIWKDYYTILALRRKNNATEIVEIGVDTEEIQVIHIVDFVQIYAQFIVNSRVDCKKSLPAVWHENSLSLRCRYIQTNIGEHQSILLLEGENIISDQICQVKMLQTGNQPLLFLLTKTSVFYVNGLKFHSSVGSFCFTNDFILLLTLENRLYCLPVNSLLKMLPNLTDPRQILTEGREIERGAQLVVSENNGTRVWFQMRRGNLELIHPREIVVRSLRRDLDCRLWRKVFMEMRRHRVDLNLLYDHNPKTFMEDLDDFVEQIGDVDQLNVFLTTLQPHDSTSRMFASQYPDRAHTQKTSETKINEICEKLRNILMNLPDEKRKIQFYPVVLTTFVVERPIKISTALLNMRDMLEQLNGESAQMGQRWLRHINYFVNDDTFLKEAMRTYDLEIVLMVAQAINMDPKEYLPILTALKDKSPAAYQQFHIDLFLENWDSALEHIAPLAQMQNDLAPTFLAECIEHIQQHNLFQLALKLFAGKPNFKEICKIVANDSEKHGHLKEAAILYRKAEDFAPALNCLLANQDFHGYLRLATSIGLPYESIEKALLKMVAHLMQKGEYLIAAEVFTYLGKESNAEKIIDSLSKAYAWKKLVAFVEECGSSNATLWDKCCVILATRCAEIIEQLDGWKDAIGKHLKRLEIVREEKANKLKRLADPNETNEDANDDETSSQSSQSSVASWGTQNTSTHKVSRRKRHIERKKQQIKEGSQWEDAALLVALKAIFIGINQQQEELVELMPALLAMDLVEKGRRLQSEMQSLLQFAESFVGTIWPEYLEVHQLPGPISDIYRNERGMWPITGEMPACIQLDDELHRPSLKSSRDWRLNIFE